MICARKAQKFHIGAAAVNGVVRGGIRLDAETVGRRDCLSGVCRGASRHLRQGSAGRDGLLVLGIRAAGICACRDGDVPALSWPQADLA